METMVKLFVIFSLILALVTFPFFSKKDVHFGVYMPKIDLDKRKKIRMKFMVLNTIAGIIASYMILKIEDPLWGVLGVTFGYLGVGWLIYLRAYNEVKALKQETLGEVNQSKKRQVVVLDTSFTKDKGKMMRVSPWYFLIPLLIVVVVVIISLVHYDVILDPIPMHYNLAGQVDAWADKSYGSALILPMVSLAMTGLFYLIYVIIGKSKQQLNPSNPRVSSKQNRKYRRIWSGYMVLSASLMNMLFAYMQLMILRGPIEKVGQMMGVVLGFTLLMIGSSLAIGFYAGNGGRKLKVAEEDAGLVIEESDDDQYWWWGSIYYNPNDPSVFVEKRVGIGWTLNMATTKGKLFFWGTIVFVIVVLVISIVTNK